MDNRERTSARDKNKGNEFRWQNNMKILCSGEKMRNATSQKGDK